MSRRKAFLTHLAISAALAAALLLLFVGFVFPMPFFVEDGGWRGLRLIVAVDVIVGPLITLIVIHPRKSRGKIIFDLAFIGALQLATFSAGLWTVYGARTQSVIYADGNFFSIDAATGAAIGPNYEKLVKNSTGGLAYGVIDLPDPLDERQRVRAEALKTRTLLSRRDDLLKPFGNDMRVEIELSALPPAKLVAADGSLAKLEDWVKASGGGMEDYIFIPTRCRYGIFLTVIARRDMTIAGHIRGATLKI